MNNQKEIFNRPFRGFLKVEIEGIGKMSIQGIGEPIQVIISIVEALLSCEITTCDMNAPSPYELVSFDEATKQIVVRKKAT